MFHHRGPLEPAVAHLGGPLNLQVVHLSGASKHLAPREHLGLHQGRAALDLLLADEQHGHVRTDPGGHPGKVRKSYQ